MNDQKFIVNEWSGLLWSFIVNEWSGLLCWKQLSAAAGKEADESSETEPEH